MSPTLRAPIVALALALALGTACSDSNFAVLNLPPTVAITSHGDGDTVAPGLTALTGTATDENDAASALFATWWVDGVVACAAEALAPDGSTSCAAFVREPGASVLLEVTDSRDATGEARVRLAVGVPVDAPPTVSFVSPSPGEHFAAGASVHLIAAVSDAEDPPEALTVTWTSSRDGVLATAPAQSTGTAALTTTTLSPGAHTLTASAKDTSGGQSSATLALVIDGGDTGIVDTGTGTADTGTDTGTVDTGTDTGTVGPRPCQFAPQYERLVHTAGAADLGSVAWSPDGTYALITPVAEGELLRYDAGATDLVVVDSRASQRWTELAFAEDGSYALIGGATNASPPQPVLYVYTPTAGLTPLADIVGVGTGKLPSPARIGGLAQRPGTNTWAILSDDAGTSNQIAYLNLFEPDWTTGVHGWRFGGAAPGTSQGTASIAWGKRLGQPVAIGVTNYVDLLVWDHLTSSLVHTQPPGYGNLRKVAFRKDGQVAWLLNTSANALYTWDGALHNDFNWRLQPNGYTAVDFAASEDEHWRTFVGRNGQVWWTDAAWSATVDMSHVYATPIPGWTGSPYFGGSNDYLNGVAWRPGTCEGLIVGDAVGGQGLVVRFSLPR